MTVNEIQNNTLRRISLVVVLPIAVPIAFWAFMTAAARDGLTQVKTAVREVWRAR